MARRQRSRRPVTDVAELHAEAVSPLTAGDKNRRWSKTGFERTLGPPGQLVPERRGFEFQGRTTGRREVTRSPLLRKDRPATPADGRQANAPRPLLAKT